MSAGVRLVTETLPEALIAVSFSKNLGLYRERVGALITVSQNESRADAVQSHVLQIARSIYSMPPDHGAAIAACIFADPALKRILDRGTRRHARPHRGNALAAGGAAAGRHDRTARSISSRGNAACSRCSACPSAAVEALRTRHHIYMLGGQPHESRGHHAAQRGLCAESIAAER